VKHRPCRVVWATAGAAADCQRHPLCGARAAPDQRALSGACAAGLSLPQSLQRKRRSVRQDAAFEQGVELGFGKLRQVGAGLSLGEEGRRVLLHQAVQRGLLRAVVFAGDRGAIRRPLGPLAIGLHKGLTRR